VYNIVQQTWHIRRFIHSIDPSVTSIWHGNFVVHSINFCILSLVLYKCSSRPTWTLGCSNQGRFVTAVL